MDIRPLLQVTTVLLAAGAGAYFGVEHWGRHEVATANTGTSRADYLVDGIELWQSGDDGLLLRHVIGSKLSHEPSPELYVMTTPQITMYRGGQPQWHLSGDHAWSPDPKHDVWLEKHVVATHDPSAGEPLQLMTDRLHTDPGTNLIMAPDVVSITSRRGHWNGSNVQADLNASTVNFSAPVEAEYAPANRP